MEADLMNKSSIKSDEKDDFLLEDFEFTFSSIKLDPNTEFLPVYPIFSTLNPPEEEKNDQMLGFSSSNSYKICGNVSADYCKLKSNSTGSRVSESGKLKLRDIVFGRSHSEGNKFLLNSILREKKMEKKCFSLFREKSEEKKGKKGRCRSYYGSGVAGGGQMPVASSRRSFLPYRQELLSGFFYCSSRRSRF